MHRASYVAITIATIILDLVTKGWILQNFAIHDRREVIPGFFNLVHVRNTGAAFGLGAESGAIMPMILTAGAIFVFVFVAIYAYRTPRTERLLQIALHLVMGGAIGNLIDRFRFGSVVDFLDVYVTIGGDQHHWPAFNVADSAICIGIGMMLIDMWRKPAEQRSALRTE